ncbi:hypothetical protein GCM10009546_06580 [Actinomadura livida]|uniref:Tryptophan 2,3-dioxygenase n=2 Tax=Actinomadura livida TaxID=79909 RepID=A0ABN1DM63_9ACTN|nr:hypothetical protein GCM10010208_55400 [Actinomadura livida]
MSPVFRGVDVTAREEKPFRLIATTLVVMGAREQLPSDRDGTGRLAIARSLARTAPQWPPHVGVGGRSVHSTRTDVPDRTARGVLDRVARWLGPPGDPAARGRAEAFPYREVVERYRHHGRTYADPALVEALREVHARLPAPRTLPERLLADWLPSTFDQDDGDYDSYVNMPVLERLADEYPGADADTVHDAELVALLSDLLIVEGEALAADPGAHPQRVRTHATLQALARAAELAPLAAGAVGVALDSRGGRRIGRDDTALAGWARLRGQDVLDRVPAPVRRTVESAMLPTTPLHDEIMFIRSVQIFEIVYRQMFRCLERAVAALLDGDPVAAAGELDDAGRRVAATPVLFRVLTTMSRPAFAHIRAHTDGRSAVQSRAYRQVERLSAVRPPAATDARTAPVVITGPTLQEAFDARLADLGPDAMRPVAEAMLRLDRGWRAMKRTHWGITRKIIGSVPGTGGTSGADYLKGTAEIPLFPGLHDAAWERAAG